jgi:hypothetical protein
MVLTLWKAANPDKCAARTLIGRKSARTRCARESEFLANGQNAQRNQTEATPTASSQPPSRAENRKFCVGRSSDSRVRTPAFSPNASQKKRSAMAIQNGHPIALGYSGGDRPGIAPGSLYVGRSIKTADHQRHNTPNIQTRNALSTIKIVKISKFADLRKMAEIRECSRLFFSVSLRPRATASSREPSNYFPKMLKGVIGSGKISDYEINNNLCAVELFHRCGGRVGVIGDRRFLPSG